MKLTLLITSLLLSTSFISQAANIRFIWSGGGAGDGSTFTDPGNWGGEAPGSTQTIGGGSATLPGDIINTAADATNIIMQGGGTAVTTHTTGYTFPNMSDAFIIRAGHTLNIQADLDTMGSSTLLGQTGTGNVFNHTAGSFSTGAVTLGGASSNVDVNISGTADFNATSLNISSGSSLDIILGATGITPIDVTGAVTNNGTITVDTTAYDFTANGSDLTLFNAASASLGTITITGPGSASVDSSGNIIISNIPEPTSSALIGLGLLGLFSRRKR